MTKKNRKIEASQLDDLPKDMKVFSVSESYYGPMPPPHEQNLSTSFNCSFGYDEKNSNNDVLPKLNEGKKVMSSNKRSLKDSVINQKHKKEREKNLPSIKENEDLDFKKILLELEIIEHTIEFYNNYFSDLLSDLLRRNTKNTKILFLSQAILSATILLYKIF